MTFIWNMAHYSVTQRLWREATKRIFQQRSIPVGNRAKKKKKLIRNKYIYTFAQRTVRITHSGRMAQACICMFCKRNYASADWKDMQGDRCDKSKKSSASLIIICHASLMHQGIFFPSGSNITMYDSAGNGNLTFSKKGEKNARTHTHTYELKATTNKICLQTPNSGCNSWLVTLAFTN